MQKNRFQLFLIGFLTILSGYFLFPTFQDYRYGTQLKESPSPEDSSKFFRDNRKSIETAQNKRLKLGLDLQGGMHVVLEVDVMELINARARSRDAAFDTIISTVRRRAKTESAPIPSMLAEEFKKTATRMSRYFYDLRDSDDDIVKKLTTEADQAVDRAKEIIRNRVDQFGVAEPTILTQGGRRIIVELPGVSDKERVRKLLKGTAKLEFKLVREPDAAFRVLQDVNQYLALYPQAPVDVTALDSAGRAAYLAAELKRKVEQDSLAKIPDSLKSKDQIRRVNPLFMVDDQTNDRIIVDARSGSFLVTEQGKKAVTEILSRPDIRQRIPADLDFSYDVRSVSENEGLKFYRMYPLKKDAELDGKVITEAKANPSLADSKPEVSMRMDDEGTKIWARVTGANINKNIAVVLDNAVYSAPVVQSKIPNGSSVINGLGSMEEAKDLEVVLKAGALPAPVQIVEERTVGPSLGADSIRAGLNSIIAGFLVIAAFMLIYYRSAGMLANIALIFNILFVIAFLAGFGATLSLPGIAGLVLTIGMAVDANVLIFERVREESNRGKSLKMAIELGYDKAFSAILDSHVTTFAAGALLYAFGIGPIRGFAVTLMIGIAASLFTAIVITKVALDWMHDRESVTEASFG
jgi:SecD/SecF fusion protein